MNDPSASAGNPKSGAMGLSLAILAVVAAGAFFVWSMQRGVGPRVGGLAVGEEAPEISAQGWVNGKPPEDLRGKVVVVDEWATWCLPCRKEAPHLVQTYNEFKDRDDVVFIGLTSESPDSLPAIEKFLEETGITWPNGFGAMETLMAFKAEYIPRAWVISREGRVVWNYDSRGEMSDAIRAALE
ncbi:TlpA family protein disulfide reductase [Rubinisphaera margarita]|uniref:TlpA family protein disulfide reductase n=1 Tax=Rubinisphaera margarita TaxID=2909586 RepID=UPI001EE911DA|nr:TlpA disulfide reductase family protein [Rubinisphaera margarita]MCG6156238.1 TlpA family protein disulfide reductase [Rubinisphaera margarita]